MVKKVYNKLFGPSRLECVDVAIKNAAQRQADIEEARIRANYYSDLVQRIDPWKDHWGFAHVRGKQLEAQEECLALEAKASALAQQVQTLLGEFIP